MGTRSPFVGGFVQETIEEKAERTVFVAVDLR